ncbi:MED14-domain-containing protein [Flagelloscypha sp. PMI_526]|nr:MED14-domain-containing protein [Flagelloscypha sp. PMI_526]
MDTASSAVKSHKQQLLNGALNGFGHLAADKLVPDHVSDAPPPVEVLEKELPVVDDGQVPLGELVARVVQQIYAELSESAETMPNQSDVARKRILANWVVKTKKNVAKLYAVVKWSRDSQTVQRSMNIVAYIMSQQEQFSSAITSVENVRDNLDGARMRNHDILTSLDVLSTGSYQRLPSIIKKSVIPPTPLSDSLVAKTLSDIQTIMQYRLRLHELIPVQMSHYTISQGRVHFTAPRLFKASLCLTGAERTDGWFFVDAEFLFKVGGQEALQEFPRVPSGILKRFITDEVDARLGYYIPPPPPPPGAEPPSMPERPTLPAGTIDAPLVRLFNFLQTMSLSYQLEILGYQAQRMRSLGWAKHLNARFLDNKQSLVLEYWVKQPSPPLPNSRLPKVNLPPFAGTVKISIVPGSKSQPPPSSLKKNIRPSIHAAYRAQTSARSRILGELQHVAKLGHLQPSDDVERLCFQVDWETSKGAFGLPSIPPEELRFEEDALAINSEDLDFERLLARILDKHIRAVLLALSFQLHQFYIPHVFTLPGVVRFINEGSLHSLHVRISPSEIAVISIDPRTGRMTLRDTGALAAAARGPRFATATKNFNDSPYLIGQHLFSLRQEAILELVEQKAMYLGLQSHRKRNLPNKEMQKFGPNVRTQLFVSLAMFANHYLVVVVDDLQLRFALISCHVVSENPYAVYGIKDIAWLDFDRIRNISADGVKSQRDFANQEGTGAEVYTKFVLETSELRDLYHYCCARVAFMKVETQLKQLSIQFSYISPSQPPSLIPELSRIQSSLARSVPALCVASRQLLAGAPAAEAAMPNVRIIPLNWWTDKGLQFLTCIKLKYVQQPMGKAAAGSSGSTVIRPSQRIIYDTQEAVVSFLGDNVDTLLKEIQDEWGRVSQMVVIAREVAQMAENTQWSDVRLLSFDLQTVQFVYAQDYTVLVAYENPDDFTSSRFHLRFSRLKPEQEAQGMVVDQPQGNPHTDAEPFLRNILIRGHGRLASSVHRLVSILRDTLPLLEELERMAETWNTRPHRTLHTMVDTLPKAAGWYRLVYGDSRYALDFRLMTDSRLAILDASHSLHLGGDIPTPSDERHVFRPIPGLAEIIKCASKDLSQADQVPPRSITSIGIGLICKASSATVVVKTVHDLVAKIFP